jgi:hypothetical protein
MGYCSFRRTAVAEALVAAAHVSALAQPTPRPHLTQVRYACLSKTSAPIKFELQSDRAKWNFRKP